MGIFLLAAIAVAIIWGLEKQKEVIRLKERLRPIESIETYVKISRQSADKALEEALNERNTAKEEAVRIVNSAKEERHTLLHQIDSLRLQRETAKHELKAVEEALYLKAEDAHLLEVGYYETRYAFDDLADFAKAIEQIKHKQKEMLKLPGEKGDRLAAAYATSKIIYNTSEKEGERMIKKVLQLMLRAFNGECDSFIARVNYRNIITMEKRTASCFDQINRLASTWNCELNSIYLNNRISELRLVYEYAELEQRVKEEQFAIRQQEREDEKARREARRRERDAARREVEAQKAIEAARTAFNVASAGEEEMYRERIIDLERQLAEAQEERRRAKSLAEQTRAGYVYIFSNVGSFGEHVFKIGMTRREDPEERRRELGGASVPFPFDCHAYIWTEDAPTLERALHRKFNTKRINLENQRKEFFRITLDEIKNEIDTLKAELAITAEIRWTLLAEAKDFRMSEAKRKYLRQGPSFSTETQAKDVFLISNTHKII